MTFYIGRAIIILVIIAVTVAIFKGKDDKEEPVQSEANLKTEAVAETNTSNNDTEAAKETVQLAETSNEETASEEPEQQTESTSDIRPELKEFLDSYEAFMDEYCEFMQNYNSSDLTQLTKYTQLLTKYAEFAEKAASWEDKELNNQEIIYYTEVVNRVSQKLIKTGLEVQ